MQEIGQKKILYIEDDAESRTLMADILKLHGFKFFGASRGLEGIRIATKELPDLILMDINLPDMQGYEVTTLLKSINTLGKIPIIALTADTKKGARERTITAGCDGYISKPINVTDFLRRIDEYLHGKKETVAPDLEKKYLTEYNIRLVEKLQDKIEEMEKVNVRLFSINEELQLSKDQLTDYNNRLFYMNNLANFLRIQKTPEELLRLLPHKILEGFRIDRCMLFEYQEESGSLKLCHSAGISERTFKRLKFKFDSTFLNQLKEETRFLWIKNKEEIINKSILKMAQSLNSISFILSCLSGGSKLGEKSNLIRSFVSETSDNSKSLTRTIPSRNILIFLDRGYSQDAFATYEIRVLKSFLQAAGIIYENMLLHHKLMKLYKVKELEAITDPLTKVYNYRYFRMQFDREHVRAERNGKPFSLAMIDIDNFKLYNDAHGHIKGDEILKLVAQSLVKNIRKSDILARYGGDEFVIIFPELAKERAKDLAVKLCQVIEKTKFPLIKRKSNIKLTISLGIATFPDDGKTEKVLVKKADDALYQAKSLGRNAVCISV